MSSKLSKYVRSKLGRKKKRREPQIVRGMGKQDSATDVRNAETLELELKPVEDEDVKEDGDDVADAGDDELVVVSKGDVDAERAAQVAAVQSRRKIKTLWGLPPIVMAKPF